MVEKVGMADNMSQVHICSLTFAYHLDLSRASKSVYLDEALSSLRVHGEMCCVVFLCSKKVPMTSDDGWEISIGKLKSRIPYSSTTLKFPSALSRCTRTQARLDAEIMLAHAETNDDLYPGNTDYSIMAQRTKADGWRQLTLSKSSKSRVWTGVTGVQVG